MTARKLSISVPPEVEETIKAAAAEEGKPVSAWLAEAERSRIIALAGQPRPAASSAAARGELAAAEEAGPPAPVPHPHP